MGSLRLFAALAPIAARGHGAAGGRGWVRARGRGWVRATHSQVLVETGNAGAARHSAELYDHSDSVADPPAGAEPPQSRSAECRKGPTGHAVPNGMGPAQLGEIGGGGDGGDYDQSEPDEYEWKPVHSSWAIWWQRRSSGILHEAFDSLSMRGALTDTLQMLRTTAPPGQPIGFVP